MDSVPFFRLTLMHVCLALSGGYHASAQSSELVPSIESEDSFNRTSYCVKGGMPMEVQFFLPSNPVKARGQRLEMAMVNQLAGGVDGRIASLLGEAGKGAWKSVAPPRQVTWSASFAKKLELEVAGEIAERAPEALGIEFCGSRAEVGSASLAAIVEYFSRSVQLDDDQQPEWVRRLSDPSKAGSIMLLAVVLRLAEIDFDPEVIAALLSQP